MRETPETGCKAGRGVPSLRAYTEPPDASLPPNGPRQTTAEEPSMQVTQSQTAPIHQWHLTAALPVEENEQFRPGADNEAMALSGSDPRDQRRCRERLGGVVWNISRRPPGGGGGQRFPVDPSAGDSHISGWDPGPHATFPFSPVTLIVSHYRRQ